MSVKSTTDNFRVSPSVLGPLGAEQLNDPALALLELVKNSWDADATRVKIKVSGTQIRVSDNGHGMGAQAFRDKWLTIGTPNKRITKRSPGGRPLIGEKGLGRLATFALGRQLDIQSSNGQSGFKSTINWVQLLKAPSLEQYAVKVQSISRAVGTEVTIRRLQFEWKKEHSEFLADHLRFLTSVPNQRFAIVFSDPWDRIDIESQDQVLKEISRASISVTVNKHGDPIVESCMVDGSDKSNVVFRKFSESKIDANLAGANINLLFFLRNVSTKLTGALSKSRARALLNEYAGIRIYLDGINVPPYGLRGNDWASLEQQRTKTGGPTMTPGNSQLFGEVKLSRRLHTNFVVTAGRSGFADQQAVAALGEYVQWTVRSLGTARRAAEFGIDDGAVPSRAKKGRKTASKPTTPQALRRKVSETAKGSPDVEAAAKIEEVIEEYESLWSSFTENDEWLRLFAQLASSGIAATSFAHELRADFDVVSSTIRQLMKPGAKKAQLITSLDESWASIKSFASLFQMMPVRVRRKKQLLSHTKLLRGTRKVAKLAQSQGVRCNVSSDEFHVNLVPAELDSIVLNLVSNSLKAVKESKNRKAGRIKINFEASRGTLIVSVKDNGCGVTKSVREVMYKPLEGSFREGTGMGLPIIQYLADQYGGSVSSLKPEDAVFETEFRVALKRVIRG